jgi:hypothetical protein
MFFSFVPCKIGNDENMKGFQRVVIPFNGLPHGKTLTTNAQAIKHLSDDPTIILDIWKAIVTYTTQQGFYLGIRFEEPPQINLFNQNFPFNR